MRESKFGTDTVVWLFSWTSALFASMDTIVPLIQPVDPPEEDWLWMYTSAPASKAVGLPASYARENMNVIWEFEFGQHQAGGGMGSKLRGMDEVLQTHNA